MSFLLLHASLHFFAYTFLPHSHSSKPCIFPDISGQGIKLVRISEAQLGKLLLPMKSTCAAHTHPQSSPSYEFPGREPLSQHSFGMPLAPCSSSYGCCNYGDLHCLPSQGWPLHIFLTAGWRSPGQTPRHGAMLGSSGSKAGTVKVALRPPPPKLYFIHGVKERLFMLNALENLQWNIQFRFSL